MKKPDTSRCACVSKVEVDAKMVLLTDRDPPERVLEVRVRCALCRAPFRFNGLPLGVSTSRPVVSFDRLEALLPMEPTA